MSQFHFTWQRKAKRNEIRAFEVVTFFNLIILGGVSQKHRACLEKKWHSPIKQNDSMKTCYKIFPQILYFPS